MPSPLLHTVPSSLPQFICLEIFLIPTYQPPFPCGEPLGHYNTTTSLSNHFLYPNTPSRKSRARKQRQTRKSTQPVPADLIEQLSKHDRELELAEELKSTSSSSVEDTTDGPAPKDGNSEKKQQPQRVTMSTYRPSARPTSHITAESVAPNWPPKVKAEDKTKAAEPVAPTWPHKAKAEDKTKAAESVAPTWPPKAKEDKSKVADGKGRAASEVKKKLSDENSVINIASESHILEFCLVSFSETSLT